MNMFEILDEAKSQLTKTTGLKCMSTVRALKKGEEWQVTLELLEMSRIPSSTDLLGVYEVQLDAQGRMQTFERRAVRLRGEPSWQAAA